MRLFVERYAVLTQDGDAPGAGVDAAIYAGYTCKDRNAAACTASRMLARDDVQEALAWLVRHRMKNYAPRALELLMALAEGRPTIDGGKVPVSVQHGAIRDLLDRCGFGVKQQIDVNHNHEHSLSGESIDAVKQQLLADMKFLGKDLPENMRQLAAPIVDAEYAEVPALDFLDEPTG